MELNIKMKALFIYMLFSTIHISEGLLQTDLPELSKYINGVCDIIKTSSSFSVLEESLPTLFLTVDKPDFFGGFSDFFSSDDMLFKFESLLQHELRDLDVVIN